MQRTGGSSVADSAALKLHATQTRAPSPPAWPHRCRTRRRAACASRWRARASARPAAARAPRPSAGTAPTAGPGRARRCRAWTPAAKTVTAESTYGRQAGSLRRPRLQGARHAPRALVRSSTARLSCMPCVRVAPVACLARGRGVLARGRAGRGLQRQTGAGRGGRALGRHDRDSDGGGRVLAAVGAGKGHGRGGHLGHDEGGSSRAARGRAAGASAQALRRIRSGRRRRSGHPAQQRPTSPSMLYDTAAREPTRVSGSRLTRPGTSNASCC
jgi:hypothetical protein